MIACLIAVTVLIVIIAVSALAIYANHAGRNAARVRTDEGDLSTAWQDIVAGQTMAQAQAEKPATEEAVLKRLDGGNA